jgi:hypothetical protein
MLFSERSKIQRALSKPHALFTGVTFTDSRGASRKVNCHRIDESALWYVGPNFEDLGETWDSIQDLKWLGLTDAETACVREHLESRSVHLAQVNQAISQISAPGRWRVPAYRDPQGRQWYITSRHNLHRTNGHWSVVLHRDADAQDGEHPSLYLPYSTLKGPIDWAFGEREELPPEPPRKPRKGEWYSVRLYDVKTDTLLPNVVAQVRLAPGIIDYRYGVLTLNPGELPARSPSMSLDYPKLHKDVARTMSQLLNDDSVKVTAVVIPEEEFYGEYYPEVLAMFFQGIHPNGALELRRGFQLTRHPHQHPNRTVHLTARGRTDHSGINWSVDDDFGVTSIIDHSGEFFPISREARQGIEDDLRERLTRCAQGHLDGFTFNF